MSDAVRELTPAEFTALGDEVAGVFGAALGYGAFEPRVISFPAISRQHAERAGFRAFGAFDGHRLVGFSEGYSSAPGQWWHDSVAARLPPNRRKRWLDGAFELVELHVHPEHQGRGLGGRLHDLLLQDVPHRTAMLSTRRADTPAMALYRKRGWVAVIDEMLFPGNPIPFQILGLDLRRSA
jgi:ribosomal protein S18 acetylase RimI-like enzyme